MREFGAWKDESHISENHFKLISHVKQVESAHTMGLSSFWIAIDTRNYCSTVLFDCESGKDTWPAFSSFDLSHLANQTN